MCTLINVIAESFKCTFINIIEESFYVYVDKYFTGFFLCVR